MSRSVGVVTLVSGAVAVAWAATALDDGGKRDDVATAIVVSALIAGALVFGYVRRRWSAVAWVVGAYGLYVTIEQLRWEDTPGVSGTDDLEPSFGLLLAPFVALVPALGVWLGKAVAARGVLRGAARVSGALGATTVLTTGLVLAWKALVALTGRTGDCTRIDCSPLADFDYNAGRLVILLCVLTAAAAVRRLTARTRRASSTGPEHPPH